MRYPIFRQTHAFFPTTLCGVLVFDSVSRVASPPPPRLLPPPPASSLCQPPASRPPSFTHNFVTHHLSHTALSHTIFHTQLCHTPSFTSFTYNFVTHHLSHTTLSNTIFHTQLCQTPSFTSFTYNFVTRHLSHITSTVVLSGRRGTNSHLRHFAWQVWHKLTSTIVLRGRRGTDGSGWRAWSDLVTRDAAALCVAGVAQTHIYSRFAWQAWHKLTSTIVLRGRRGANSHLPSFGVVGVALMALGGALGLIWSPVTPRHFAWQAWHKLTSTIVLRGSRGTNSHLPSFGVAGVALMALGGALGLIWSPVTPRHFAWQAWHKLTSTVVLRGRRGTNSHLRHFAWQVWHKLTSTIVWRGRRGTDGSGWRAWSDLVTLRGRCGTNSHLPSFWVAVVAPSTIVLPGKRCVAGVALMALGGALGVAETHIYHRFAWQAWH